MWGKEGGGSGSGSRGCLNTAAGHQAQVSASFPFVGGPLANLACLQPSGLFCGLPFSKELGTLAIACSHLHTASGTETQTHDQTAALACPQAPPLHFPSCLLPPET